MSFDADNIYGLLPAYVRLRDAQQGGPLKDFLSVIADQVAVLQEDMAQTYDNLFIETCAPWVVPYIGDLVRTTPLFDIDHVFDTGTAGSLATDLTGPQFQPDIALRARADVAKTIFYRRRKATLPLLEQLAADVTGWACHVREFFETLAWTQAVRNHVRLDSFYAPDLRSVPDIDRIDGPFDTAPRVVDVRPPSQFEGWHNIPNIGFFLYRLKSTAIDQATPRPVGAAGDFRFHVSPLGQKLPLFARWREGIDATVPTAEPLLPGPIRPAAFYDDLLQYGALPPPGPGFTQYYGHFGGAPAGTLPDAPGASLFITVNGTPVAPEQIQTMNLDVWRQPLTNIVGIDVARGRLAFGPDWNGPQSVKVSYFNGFPADLGGGGYQRQPWLLRRSLDTLAQIILVDQSGATPGSVTTIGAALTQWDLAGKLNTLISIVDSATYAETLTIEPADNSWLVIEAADRQRPHLQLGAPLTITGSHDSAALTLSGLLVEGAVQVTGSLGRLRLLHTTLVPGLALDENSNPTGNDPSITAAPGTATEPLNLSLQVELLFSITGPLHLPPGAGRLWILDSIVDGIGGAAVAADTGAPNYGPPAWIERSTLIGPSFFRQIVSATEVLFTGIVTVERRQQGCVRFSFVPDQSRTPRRYRCQPDFEIQTEIDAAQGGGPPLTDAQQQAIHDQVVRWLQPQFTWPRYGQPAYAQLHLNCPTQISQGAEDGSEMGAYCHLKQPQRLKNLQLRLEEYLPFGREAGIIFVT